MVHIFDIDNTVIRKSSTWYFLNEAIEKGIIHFSQICRLPYEWLRYRLGCPNMDFIEEAVRHIAGIEKKILEETALSCFERRMKCNIYTGAASLIREAQSRGEKVIFATSSFHTIVQPLQRFLGIEESLASALEFRNGKTTGNVEGSSLFGGRKKTAVETWLTDNGIPPESACFYSDSYTDLSLLEFCGKPVAVNPDRLLAREAKKRGWQVLRFTQTSGKAG